MKRQNRLQSKGFTVLNAEAKPENASGIVTFYQPGKDLAPLHKKLETAGVVASLRNDRKGQNYLRLSPHFYNRAEEVEFAVDQISEILATRAWEKHLQPA